jgi:phosphomannomutase
MGAPVTRADFDGVRLDWADAWFGVRASNTEPILRLAGEMRSQEKLDELIAIAKTAALQ